MAKNDINSNFHQIAVTDGTDGVLGIRALASNMQIGGATSAGQVLVSTGTTTTSPLAWATVATLGSWTSEPLTVTAVNPAGGSVNPTLAAGSRNFIKAVKIAEKTYRVEFLYNATVAGTSGSGVYMFTLPGGLQFDTAAQPLSTVNANNIASTAGWNEFLPGSSGFITIAGVASIFGVMPQSASTFKLPINAPSAGTNYVSQFYGSGNYGFAQAALYLSGSFTLIATV